MFATDYAISIIDLSKACEDHGFESLWLPEHSHIPVSLRSAGPVGKDLSPEYARTLDPFVGLSAAAAVTSNLRLGTGICLVIQRDPIHLAKEVASLDHLSGGRFLFGVGGGWNHEEMQNHGTNPADRWDILRERISAMKAIWTEERAEFHGQFTNFDPMWSWPKPIQKPHPPVLVGGASPNTMKRVVEYGDGWIPTLTPDLPLRQRISELKRLAEQSGRAPIPVTITGRLIGGYGVPSREQIEGYAADGAERCVFWLPPAEAKEALPRLAQFAQLAKAIG